MTVGLTFFFFTLFFIPHAWNSRKFYVILQKLFRKYVFYFMLLKIRYKLRKVVVFIFCFIAILVANGVPKNAENVAICFPELPKEYKKLRKAIDKIEKKSEDNYLYLLPVYNLNYQVDTTTETWKTLSSIIQKASEEIDYAVTKISNYCPNIAEIYKLKGIALFYQKEYQLAYEVFETITNNYPNSASLAETYIWLARTSIYLYEYEKTVFCLAEAEKRIDTNLKDIYLYYHHVAAEYHIDVNDYKKALEHLTTAIQMGSPLDMRLSFIAAQIQEEMKSYNAARTYYNRLNQRSIFSVLLQKQPISSLMKSYSLVHAHLCEKNIEKLYFDSIVEQQWREANPVPKEFEPTMVESYHDSAFFVRNYPYYFNDYAAMFFLDESFDESWENENDEDYEDYEDDEADLSDEMLESLFENWESISVHIPKTDFSNMKDTVYLPLIGNIHNYELPHFGTVVSRFGWRRYRYHYGTDIKGNTGDSICCVFDGVVRIAVRNKTYGNVIIVRHYNGLETFYAHCSKLLVVPNQEVKSGEVIGLVGNTGRSRGPHLHFESRYKGTAFNPEYMIDFENNKLKSDTLVLTKEVFNYKNTYSTGSTSYSSGKYYTVKSGDTLSTIARRYRTNVSILKKINGLKSDTIRAGQRLRIP